MFMKLRRAARRRSYYNCCRLERETQFQRRNESYLKLGVANRVCERALIEFSPSILISLDCALTRYCISTLRRQKIESLPEGWHHIQILQLSVICATSVGSEVASDASDTKIDLHVRQIWS